LVWQQSQSGENTQIWTIFAGDPPDGPLSSFAQELHTRWQTGRDAPTSRRAEDAASCQIMGADYRHFALPDCIYRTDAAGNALYTSDPAIFGPISPLEAPRVNDLATNWERDLPPDAVLVSPLTLGGHVDHLLVRAAAEKVRCPHWYYLDFPYALRYPEQIHILGSAFSESVVFPLSEAAVQAWARAVAAHHSQLSTFWPDLETAQNALAGYAALMGGVRLFRN
jgi:LmbE family N-acetylglucosaminyl deacetylase